MNEHDVFKALADESRRILLDALIAEDGQTLAELCTHLPTMTRFGVMKHLQILEEAHVITTRKIGREKYHYLNRVPIQEIYDRWVSKFSRPWSQTLTTLKYTLESEPMNDKPAHVQQIFIRATPEELWKALTDSKMTRMYFFACTIESDWTPGAPYTMRDSTGNIGVSGTVLEIDRPKRLVTTFRAHWAGEGETTPETVVTYEIEQLGATCKLTLTHSGLIADNPMHEGFKEGWAQILSSLKTLIETGQPLIIDREDN